MSSLRKAAGRSIASISKGRMDQRRRELLSLCDHVDRAAPHVGRYVPLRQERFHVTAVCWASCGIVGKEDKRKKLNMHQTFQITAQKEWKKECPTFSHKIVDGSLNLASCFDTEGKGTQFLWDAHREEAWDQSPCSLPLALYHRASHCLCNSVFR